MFIELSTPSVVFQAMSIMILAYTNRFIAISKRVRALHAEYQQSPNVSLANQIRLLKKRLILIRNMQATAIIGFLCSVLSIGALFLSYTNIGNIFFGLALICLAISLMFCFTDIYLSVRAMKILLDDDLQ